MRFHFDLFLCIFFSFFYPFRILFEDLELWWAFSIVHMQHFFFLFDEMEDFSKSSQARACFLKSSLKPLDWLSCLGVLLSIHFLKPFRIKFLDDLGCFFWKFFPCAFVFFSCFGWFLEGFVQLIEIFYVLSCFGFCCMCFFGPFCSW